MDTKKSLRAEIRSLQAEIKEDRAALSNAYLENERLKARVSELIRKLGLQGRETRDRALDQAINSVTRLGAVDVVELARSYEAYLSGSPNSSVSNEEMDFTQGMEEAGYSISAIEDVIRMAREAGVL